MRAFKNKLRHTNLSSEKFPVSLASDKTNSVVVKRTHAPRHGGRNPHYRTLTEGSGYYKDLAGKSRAYPNLADVYQIADQVRRRREGLSQFLEVNHRVE